MENIKEFFCPKCNGVRWRTVVKGKNFKCRECGFVGVGMLKPFGSYSGFKTHLSNTRWRRFINWVKKLFKKGEKKK